jgi:cell division protein FtsQ
LNVFLQNQEVRHESQRRKRVLHVLKHVQQISLIVCAWLLGVAALYGAYVLVVDRHLFIVTRVDVDGDLHHLRADDIRTSSGVQQGQNLFRIDMTDVQKRVSEDPWVAEVTVRRKLPHALWIYVTEREPVAIMTGKEDYYVDAKGVAFSAGDAVLEDLPLMTGFASATPDDVLRGIALLTHYEGHSLFNEFGVSELHFDASQGFSIVGSVLPVVIRVGWKDFDAKLNQFTALWPVMRTKEILPSYVDTNVSGKVIAKYDN